MKPSNELIWALRRAATRIVDPKTCYYWSNVTLCNCGLLIRELCGLSEEELHRKLFAGPISSVCGTWSGFGANHLCEATGIPMDEVYAQLRELGFTKEDFFLIEFAGCSLSDGRPSLHTYENRQYVSKFFLDLADKLELELTGTITNRDGSLEQTLLAQRATTDAEADSSARETGVVPNINLTPTNGN